MNNNHIIIYLMAAITLTNCSSLKDIFSKGGKPDLIITNVVPVPIVERSSQIRTYNDSTTVLGGVEVPPPNMDVAITVKNIGTATFTDVFYLSYTNLKSDIIVGRYSQTSRVNSDKRLILVGDSLILNFNIMSLVRGFEAGTLVKFFIQTDGKPHDRGACPRIEELNYDNNAFDFIIPNEIK